MLDVFPPPIVNSDLQIVNLLFELSTMRNTKKITFIALSAAVICILGPLSIPLPISPVPLSLTILAIYFGVYILGMKGGTASCAIYILLGLAGLPVFSGFTGGAGKLLGPTGGYIIGYLFVALLSGLLIDRFPQNRGMHFLGMLSGTTVCYLFGTVWLAFQAGMTFTAALFAGVIPFLPADLLKMLLALILGPKLRTAIRKIR